MLNSMPESLARRLAALRRPRAILSLHSLPRSIPVWFVRMGPYLVTTVVELKLSYWSQEESSR